jgi:hypothetical protein
VKPDVTFTSEFVVINQPGSMVASGKKYSHKFDTVHKFGGSWQAEYPAVFQIGKKDLLQREMSDL